MRAAPEIREIHAERLRGGPAALSSAQGAFTRAERGARAISELVGWKDNADALWCLLHVGLTMHAVPAPPCARAPPLLHGCLARVARDMTSLRLFKRVLLMMVCAG